MAIADTFERSCQHWSEAGRKGMEQFYALASFDYVNLAGALDWPAWFEAQQAAVGDRPLKLLDVACGSGKFPTALRQHAAIERAAIQPVEYSLLDPAAFSIAEARAALAPPFVPSQEYEATLQNLECAPGQFDIVWATHALYAIPQAELAAGLTKFVHAMGGAGFIAHASETAHYLRFYQLYLEGFKDGVGEPYSSAEQLSATFADLGVPFRTEQITYENSAPCAHDAQVEGYLQRCLFDDSVSLDEMRANPATGPYLETCLQDDHWRFRQNVTLFFL
ncbi:MAG: class I SAM-dependent methyltransferase [Pseudomonadota bacterium]